MRRLLLLICAGCAGLVLFVSPAYGRTHHPPGYVPPNDSAAAQYTEDVPTAGGDKPASTIHGPSGPGPGSGSSGGSSSSSSASSNSIPAKTLGQLSHSGASGQAAASLARALSPSKPASSTEEPASPSGSSAGQVVKTLGGADSGGGIGILLPIILIASLLVATGLGLLRLRRPGA